MNKYLMKDEFLLRGMRLSNFIFDKGLFQVEKKLLILNINLTGHKKVHFEYDSWSS